MFLGKREMHGYCNETTRDTIVTRIIIIMMTTTMVMMKPMTTRSRRTHTHTCTMAIVTNYDSRRERREGTYDAL